MLNTASSTLHRALLGLSLLACGVQAQPVMPTEFPDGAVPMAPEDLSARIGGKVHRIKFFDGSAARIDYKTNGYVFLDMSSGFRDSGNWRVDGTKLCTEWRQVKSSCSEARLKDETVYVKRVVNGEIVSLASD